MFPYRYLFVLWSVFPFNHLFGCDCALYSSIVVCTFTSCTVKAWLQVCHDLTHAPVPGLVAAAGLLELSLIHI